jgi:CheY-like chemotaxis protein
MLGHELRNPLGAIANAARVLEMDPETEAADKARLIIRRQIDHLSRLVDDLLDVARVMKGKFVLNRVPVEVVRTVGGVLEALRSAEHLNRHETSLEAEEVWVYADPVRLEQVVANLVVNGTKYTPEGGAIRIRVWRDGRDAVIEVADSGIGMDQQLLPRVFDLFAQGAQTLDRAQGGLGIGLTLVRRLVELHDGQVQAASKGTGEGSVFTVRLPAMERPVDSRPPSPVEASARSILLVDDNDDSREMLAALLEHAGHTVCQSSDGPGGVEAALRERPDVALVDIGLPGLDGYEVARRVRTDPRGSGIALIALTGYGSREQRAVALDSGFDCVLVKPVEPASLQRALGFAKLEELAKL